MRHSALLACLLAAGALGAQSPKPTPAAKPKSKAPAVPESAPEPKKGLSIGDPAPALKVGRWVKGAPVTELKKGEVTVVEFWATWCGPCRETIPHLTEMAKARAGKVTFLGVSIWERGDAAEIEPKVDAFVAEMGDKIGYVVGRDTADAHMAKAWMQAAGRNSIPCAMIVDREGRVAWIGHPMAGMDKALDQILAGTFDLKAAQAALEKEAADKKAEQARQQARQKAWSEARPGLDEALKAKDYAKVLSLADAAAAKEPLLESNLRRHRFLALAHTDEAKAKAFVDQLVAKDDFVACLNTAQMLLGSGVPAGWTARALELVQKGETLEPRVKSNTSGLQLKALLRSDEAKALAFFEARKVEIPDSVGSMAEVIAEEPGVSKPWLERALAHFEGAVKEKGAHPLLNASLAKVYFGLGRAKDAVAAQEKLVADAEGKAPEAMVKEFKAELERYKAAVKS